MAGVYFVPVPSGTNPPNPFLKRLSTASGLESVVPDNFLAKRLFQNACLQTPIAPAANTKTESDGE
jgi:hypothetical protein